MTPLEMLTRLGLVSWATLSLGLKKGWVTRTNIYDYAVDQITTGEESDEIYDISFGENLSDEDLATLIEKQIEMLDVAGDLDRWRLAFLLNALMSDVCDEDKVERLQEIYVAFDYPEDMSSCSIYSQDCISPVFAANLVVQKLKKNYFKNDSCPIYI